MKLIKIALLIGAAATTFFMSTSEAASELQPGTFLDAKLTGDGDGMVLYRQTGEHHQLTVSVLGLDVGKADFRFGATTLPILIDPVTQSGFLRLDSRRGGGVPLMRPGQRVAVFVDGKLVMKGVMRLGFSRR